MGANNNLKSKTRPGFLADSRQISGRVLGPGRNRKRGERNEIKVVVVECVYVFVLVNLNLKNTN